MEHEETTVKVSIICLRVISYDLQTYYLMVCLYDECWPYLAVPRHLIMKIDIEDLREVLICVKGVPICYVHIDGSITYLSQIVSILNTYI